MNDQCLIRTVNCSPATVKQTLYKTRRALNRADINNIHRLTLRKRAIPDITPRTRNNEAYKWSPLRISSEGRDNTSNNSPNITEKRGKMDPKISEPNNPNNIIHHSLALAINTRVNLTSGVSLSHCSCYNR